MIKHPKIIMHLIATNFYGGPEKQIIEHLKRLNNNLFKGQIASFLEGGRTGEILENAKIAGLMHHGITMSSPLDFRSLVKLILLLRKEKVDLLCAHHYKACVMGWLTCRILNIPIIAFSRGYIAENRKVAFYEWLERLFLCKFAGIIAVSEGQLRRIEDLGVRGKRTWVVHNAVSTNSLPDDVAPLQKKALFSKLNLPSDARLVVAAGRLSPEKGHKYLIRAIPQIKQNIKNVFFVFCGEGICQSDLEKLAYDLGIYEKCRFPGFCRDVEEIFKIMDLMVLPSLTEGLPNVVLEAFAVAKPVVATAVGGVPEIIEHERNGILVPPKRPDLLANAIDRFFSSPDTAKKMGHAGFRKVKSEFSFETQNHKLEAIYRELLHIS